MNTSNNPFQRQNRNQYRSDGPSGYGTWKSRTPVQPKEKVLTAADFPSLPTEHVKSKTTWEKPETTLADRMKELNEEDERKRCEAREKNEGVEFYAIPLSSWKHSPEAKGEVRKVVIQKESFEPTVVPLSSWLHSKHANERHMEMRKRQQMDEEEENYRWQISRDMEYPEDDYTEPYEELVPLEENHREQGTCELEEVN